MGRRRKYFNDGDFITCITFCRPNLIVGESYKLVYYHKISSSSTIIIGVQTIDRGMQYADIENFEPTHIYESKMRKLKIERLIYE